MISEAQRQARAHGLGGSDAPIVLGISPYKSPVQLFMEKTGQATPPNLDDVEPVIFGNLLEGVVADEFARRTGIKLRRVNETMIDRRDPYLFANIDRRVVGAAEVCEIKTVRALPDDQPRADHQAQVMHYMHVGGFSRGWLVYLIGGQRLVWFEIQRNQEAIDCMVDTERTFWRHVRERVAPPPMSSFDVRLLFPSDNGGSVIASQQVINATSRLAEIRAQVKGLEKQAEDAERIVTESMQGAGTLLSDAGEILATWKTAKPSQTFDRARFEADHHELAQAYLAERPGSRRFLLKVAA